MMISPFLLFRLYIIVQEHENRLREEDA